MGDHGVLPYVHQNLSIQLVIPAHRSDVVVVVIVDVVVDVVVVVSPTGGVLHLLSLMSAFCKFVLHSRNLLSTSESS